LVVVLANITAWPPSWKKTPRLSRPGRGFTLIRTSSGTRMPQQAARGSLSRLSESSTRTSVPATVLKSSPIPARNAVKTAPRCPREEALQPRTLEEAVEVAASKLRRGHAELALGHLLQQLAVEPVGGVEESLPLHHEGPELDPPALLGELDVRTVAQLARQPLGGGLLLREDGVEHRLPDLGARLLVLRPAAGVLLLRDQELQLLVWHRVLHPGEADRGLERRVLGAVVEGRG
jgi:hypothetical protein